MAQRRPKHIDSVTQTDPVHKLEREDQDEADRRRRLMYEKQLHEVKMGWPYERIRQAEEKAEKYKIENEQIRAKIKDVHMDTLG